MSWESNPLPPISQVEEYPNAEWFKAKDRKGNIYKVFNPRKLVPWQDKQGREFVARREPELIEEGEVRSTRSRGKGNF